MSISTCFRPNIHQNSPDILGVNKKRICSRLINQKIEEIAPTFSRAWSSIISEYDIGQDFEEFLEDD
jgi:hypothetical protein